LDILIFVDVAEVKFWFIQGVELNYSKLQNKAKISKFWEEVYKELNAPLAFTYKLIFSSNGPHKTYFCTL